MKVLVGDVDGAKVVLFRQLSRVHEGHQVLRSVRVGPAEDRVQGRVGVGRHQFSCDGDRGCQVGHQIGDEVLDVVDDPRDDVFEGVDDEVAHRDEEVLDAIADRGRDVAPDGGLANVAARRGDQKSDEKDRFQSHLVVWREIWEEILLKRKEVYRAIWMAVGVSLSLNFKPNQSRANLVTTKIWRLRYEILSKSNL